MTDLNQNDRQPEEAAEAAENTEAVLPQAADEAAPAEAAVETEAVTRAEADAAPETAPEEAAPEEAVPEKAAPGAGEAKEERKDPFVFSLFEYLEILAYSVAAVLLTFTLFARLCQVDGSSMRNTLFNGEMLITTDLVEVEPGDIIVFHMTSDTYEHFNEPLVKRVIAAEGQTVRIDYTTPIPTMTVDGVPVEEDYTAYIDRTGNDIGHAIQYPEYGFNYMTGVFEATVPEGHLFVMGDNRNNSADSRTVAVGMVDERRVLGKVIMRLKPFTTFD